MWLTYAQDGEPAPKSGPNFDRSNEVGILREFAKNTENLGRLAETYRSLGFDVRHWNVEEPDECQSVRDTLADIQSAGGNQ